MGAGVLCRLVPLRDDRHEGAFGTSQLSASVPGSGRRDSQHDAALSLSHRSEPSRYVLGGKYPVVPCFLLQPLTSLSAGCLFPVPLLCGFAVTPLPFRDSLTPYTVSRVLRLPPSLPPHPPPGQLYFCEPTVDAREAMCAQVQAATGAVLVPPYNHGPVIAGQGTIGLEFLEQVGAWAQGVVARCLGRASRTSVCERDIPVG